MAKTVKTPVMVLQELTVKKGYDPPEFNLVHSVEGTHENEFHYQVYVHNVSAKGFGRSKKDAKHEAARMALTMLAKKGIYHPDGYMDRNANKELIMDTSPIKAALNCIPKLMEICNENKIPIPEFKEISAVGPPHCREFTYECHVASIVTRAIAGSKKHAKQLAANDMMNRIVNVIPEIVQQHNDDQLRLMDKDMEVIKKYSDLSQFNAVRGNLSAKVTEYDQVITKLMTDCSVKLEDILQLLALQRSVPVLEQLLRLFELEFHLDIIQEHPSIVVLSVNADTPLSVMEKGNNLQDASEKALHRMFDVIHSFVK